METTLTGSPTSTTGPEPAPSLADLYDEHAAGAVRFAYLLTGDRELAQDLVQEAFLKVADRLDRLQEPDAFRGYLRTTVLNLSRMHFRRGRLERAYLQRQKPAEVAPDDAGGIEMRQTLLSLSGRQRAAVVLRYYEDLPEAEIARLLRCRPGTVKSLLSRGLAKLRTEIDEGRDDDD